MHLRMLAVVDFHCRWLDKLRSLVVSLVQGIDDWKPSFASKPPLTPAADDEGYAAEDHQHEHDVGGDDSRINLHVHRF